MWCFLKNMAAPKFSELVSLQSHRLILVTDAIGLDATLLIPQFIQTSKEESSITVLLAFSQSLAHYTAICRKWGIQINDQLIFVDGLTNLASWQSKLAGIETVPKSIILEAAQLPAAIEPLLAQITSVIEQTKQTTGCTKVTVIVDDVVPLFHITQHWSSVLHFIQSLQLAVKSLGSVVVFAHADDILSSDADYCALIRSVAHRCTMAIQMRPMLTGYSQDIDGEILFSTRFVPSSEVNGASCFRYHLKFTDTSLGLTSPGLARGVV